MVKIKSLSEQVYDYILHLIQIGELNFGDKINETELIEKLAISRTPIREALIQMASDNILDNISRKGFFVKSISEKEIQETYIAIGVLDAHAIQLAIPNITAENITELHYAIEKIDLSLAKKDYEMYSHWQEQFHMIYLELCDNHVIISLLKELLRKTLRTTFFSKNTEALFQLLKTVHEGHREIINCIEARDIEQASKQVYKHWTSPDVIATCRE